MGSTDLQFSALSIIAKKGRMAELRKIIPKKLRGGFDGALNLKSYGEHPLGLCAEGMTWRVETSARCIVIKVSWMPEKNLQQTHELDARLRSGQGDVRSVPIFARGEVSPEVRAALAGAIAGNEDWYAALSKVQ